MKKTTFLKSLLVTAGLCVGASAWAAETANFLTGSWTANTSTYSLPGANGVYHFTFTTTNDEGAFWHGWALIVTNGKDTHTHGGTQYFTMRHDGYGWNATTNSNDVDYMTGSNTYDAQNPGVATIEKAANGATVDMTITRSAGNVTVAATVTPTDGENAYEVNFSYTNGDATAESLGLYFSGEYGTVTVTNAYAVNGTVTSTQYGCNFESGETLFAAAAGADGNTRFTVANSTTQKASGTASVSLTAAHNAQNGNGVAIYDFSNVMSGATSAKVEFDFYMPSTQPTYHNILSIGDASKRAQTSKAINTTGTIFSFGTKRGKWNGNGSTANYYSINNGYTTNSIPTTVTDIWAHATVNIDFSAKTVDYSITSLNGETTHYSGADIEFLDADAESCTQIDLNTCINNSVNYIDNLVITKYVDSNKYDYTVKAVCGETELATISSGTVDNGTEVTYAISKYIIKDGELYQAKTLDTGHYYVSTVEISSDDQTEEIEYTKQSITGTPVYFADFGDTPASGTTSTEYQRCSGGQTSTKNGTFTLIPAGTLADGTYKIEIGHYKNRAPLFYVGEANVGVCNSFSNSGVYGTTTFNDVVVVDGVAITVKPNTGKSQTYVDNMDYVLAIKTSDDVTVSATIGATGWTTFASPYALDLSNITGATAYYAKTVDSTNKKVMIEKTTASVPAGEGLLLKGTAGDAVTINLADEGTAISGNMLVGCTAATTLESNADYYVLVNNNGTAEFQCLDQQGATIPAGKAYLNASAAGSARLSIMFSDDATSISSVENANVENGQYYNLNGQRTLAPQKGLYIVNGKKVVLK